MSVETQAANLATAVNGLVSAVNTAKGTLDTNVASAQTAHSATVAAYEGTRTAADDAKADVDAVYEALRSAGSLASYQDLTAITGTTADTANDVFVYDTKQDSDGGAWRHRTSHTSWYNEELGTTTRGTRREFPSVALIVAIDDAVIIYDGDDPTLPLWMKFWGSWSYSSGRMLTLVQGSGLSPATSVTMLNGKLCVGSKNASSVSGLFIIDFFTERCRLAKGGSYNTLTNHPNIAARNEFLGVNPTNTLPGIVNGRVNDVAMTVFPDAPVDPATGLPIPTIAVATDSGISVLKDDGTVVNSSITNYADHIAFDYDNLHLWAMHGSTPYVTFRYDLATMNYNKVYYDTYPKGFLRTNPATKQVIPIAEKQLVFSEGGPWWTSASWNGVYRVLEGEAVNLTTHKDLLFKTTSAYVSGWMPGDIKVAVLADTAAANLSDAEVLVNPDFATDLASWTVNQNTAWVSGAMRLESNGSPDPNSYSEVFSVTPGDTYEIVMNLHNPDTTNRVAYIRLSTTGAPNGAIEPYYGASGQNIAAGATETRITNTTVPEGVTSVRISASLSIGANNIGAKIDVLDISVRQVSGDRQIATRGISPTGTLTRAPVATGAELVGYSGFHATGTESTSTFLKQPYNSGLNFGTGEFAIMWWHYKTAAATRYVMDRKGSTNTGKWTVYSDTSGKLAFFAYDQLGTILPGGSLLATNPSPINSWVMNAVVRDSEGTLRLYTDGKLNGSRTGFTGDITDTSADAVLDIGNRWDHANSWDGSLALLRISATAPTADQIKYIYEQERHLFKENAACTLYGNSDAVTGLAYDKTSGLLHVGTSSGRSTFQGLQRVDNTTTGVTTAISANDGVVIEQ